MTAGRTMRWVTAVMEACLGIPFLGGIFILSLSWTPLFVMLVLHIITLVLSRQNKEPGYGSIVGIIASALGWIPVLGMVLHIAAALALFVSANKKSTVY